MITFLVDSNALRQPGLEVYLQSSRDHVVAFSDLTLTEMRKTNALSTSRASLRIVSKYPDQMYVLRRADLLLDANITSAGQTDELFDYAAGLELEALCRALRTVPVPVNLVEHMAEAESGAQLYMERLTDEVKALEPGLIDAAKDFTTQELTQLRDREDIAEATQRKLIDLLKSTTAEFIRTNQEPRPGMRIKVRDLLGTFAFRYSLCMVIYYLEWVRVGRTTGKKVKHRVNDVVDMQLAALGTYFQGVLSKDDDLQNSSLAARAILRRFGAYVGDDWCELLEKT